MQHMNALRAAILAATVSLGAAACSESSTSMTAPQESVSFAKKSTVTTDALVEGLTNLQAGLINLGVNITDIQITDLVNIGTIDIAILNGVVITDVIDVEDVLNNNQIEALNIQIGDITIDNVLNNLLREAEILNDNQIVVGILSGQFVVQTLKEKK